MFDDKNFLNNIANERSLNVIGKLKVDELPLLIWGCGDVAYAVKKYLSENEIYPLAVMIDYSNDKEDTFYGIPILTRAEVVNKYDKFSVVLGHSHYEKGEDLKKEISSIHEVYYITSVFYEQTHSISYDFIKENEKQYSYTFGLLEDLLSKKSFCAYLNARLNDNVKYIFNCDIGNRNYFKNDIFKINKNEVYVDVGAYNGDTIKIFLDECDNTYTKIIALEPENRNYEQLEEYIKIKKLKNISLIKKGTWHCKDLLPFDMGDEKRSSLKINDKDCSVIEVDTLNNIGKDEKITFIKINFFWGVVETLKGAKDILLKEYPRLAITIGFDEWSLINLPKLIKEMAPKYRFYLRFNAAMPACLVLYATIE